MANILYGNVTNTSGTIDTDGKMIMDAMGRPTSIMPPLIINDKSPLQVFGKAKKRINDIYVEIEEYIQEIAQFIEQLDDANKNENLIDEHIKMAISNYMNMIAGIREILSRDHMKVAFFGRTSNGKSTVINAMLGEKILPSGIGHITNCFCQVEGNDCNQPYLMKDDSDEKFNVTDIKQLANALCEKKLTEDSLVRIFWPRERCNLLRNDVVFVDSPGVDVSINMDDWIDKYCLNADVFVLVVNAESTLTQVEKNFFHTVSQKLSKPNIFILNNRWDSSAFEPELAALVKAQHTNRCKTFLTKELKLMNERETNERVFFVSAREMLQARLEEAKGNLPIRGAIADGFQLRYFEFQEFEYKFEECISNSAIRTKFEKHCLRGKYLLHDIPKILDNIYDCITLLRQRKLDEKKLLNDQLEEIQTEMVYVHREMELKVNRMMDEVRKNVTRTLNDEIWHLDNVINQFKMPFYAEPLMLEIYKRELNSYIDATIGNNLKAKLSKAFAMNLEQDQQNMADRVNMLISNGKPSKRLEIVTQCRPFEMLYTLNCHNLCTDFQEDLEFKFSWGITTMMQRFTGNVKKIHTTYSNVIKRKSNYFQIFSSHINQNNHSSTNNLLLTPTTSKVTTTTTTTTTTAAAATVAIATPTTATSTTPSATLAAPSATLAATTSTTTNLNNVMNYGVPIITRIVLTSLDSQYIAGSLVIGGIALKTIGWRFVCSISALYGCIYLYERLSWTNSAKERSFKAQYARYAAKKLKMIVNLTSANCSRQVQQQLGNTFEHLCDIVETATSGMNADINRMAIKIKELEAKQKHLKTLRNKAIYIQNELNIFQNDYMNLMR